MKSFSLLMTFALVLFVGCQQSTSLPKANKAEPREQHDQVAERTSHYRTAKPDVSYDTEHDGRFAEFVSRTAGEMVQKIAVGIDRKGVMRVQLSEATAPEDTLPLTKSLLNGARKDFPGQAITLSVFDPHGEAILKAHYRPEEGVHYEVVKDEEKRSGGKSSWENHNEKPAPTASLSKSGTTEKDRKFAEWAMSKGQKFIRYVQADLERGHRLWFGVTRAVEPNDVNQLAKSLLEGAQSEFPGHELTATVFDPEGERIGKATLDRQGKVHWTK